MDAPATRMTAARLVAGGGALGGVFPLSARLAASSAPGLIPVSWAAWWRADLAGVAAPVLWAGGFTLSVWLLTTSALHAWATRRGHERVRRIVAAFTAPLVRHVVDAAIVVSIGAAAVAAPASAFATGRPIPV